MNSRNRSREAQEEEISFHSAEESAEDDRLEAARKARVANRRAIVVAAYEAGEINEYRLEAYLHGSLPWSRMGMSE